jgi:hypothetical protein
MTVRVYDLAHSRAGGKGNTSNILVICHDASHWEFLQRELTAERAADAFRHLAKVRSGVIRCATSRRSISSSKMRSAAASRSRSRRTFTARATAM